jgi:hypothetical protein
VDEMALREAIVMALTPEQREATDFNMINPLSN